jgi:tRNA pseudouridine32 synthase/23S rRNA pseudouridine746 synthase
LFYSSFLKSDALSEQGILSNMLDIILTDAEFIVANKPTRLLTVPGKGPDKQDCLYHRLLETYPDALVVHRLDMDTSGLILFARSPKAQSNLSKQFARRKIQKSYEAVVEGILENNSGRVDSPMRKDMEHSLPPKHKIDHVRGKEAITEWDVLGRTDTTTRVALYPQTGRSHQLRLHMQSIGHPIVGDNIYGKSGERLMLHARWLELYHPATGEPIQLDCPVPF